MFNHLLLCNCNDANPPILPSYPMLMTRRSLNQSEQREFAARMERKQMKEFMTVRLPLSQSLSWILGRI